LRNCQAHSICFICRIINSHNAILYYFQSRTILLQQLQDNNSSFSEHDCKINLLIAFNCFLSTEKKFLGKKFGPIYASWIVYIILHSSTTNVSKYFFYRFVFWYILAVWQTGIGIILNKSPNRTVFIPFNRVYDWNHTGISKRSSFSILIYSSMLNFQEQVSWIPQGDE